MASYNRVEIIGHLGKDPELKKIGDQEVCKFSVATSESFMKNGSKFEKTEWHRVSIWGKSAANCAKYLKTGSKVFLEGKLETSKYNKNGVDHYSTQIVAFRVLFLDTKKEGSPQDAPPESPNEYNVRESEAEPDFSEIPF